MTTQTLSRRSFLAFSAILPWALQERAGKTIPIGLELYSVRDEFKKRRMRSELVGFDVAKTVGQKPHAPLRAQFGIKELEGPGRGIAGIGKLLLSGNFHAG